LSEVLRYARTKRRRKFEFEKATFNWQFNYEIISSGFKVARHKMHAKNSFIVTEAFINSSEVVVVGEEWRD